MKLRFGAVSLLLLFFIGCRSFDVSIQPHEDAAQLKALALAVHEKVNAHRAANKLSALRLDARLSRLARRKSAAMSQGGEFSHTGFKIRARQINQLIPCRHVGENLAHNTHVEGPAARAMEMWLNSPAHRRVMERPYFRVTGIAVAKSPGGQYYFTQLFVCPK
jgi:uncharacterized protein YkwD